MQNYKICKAFGDSFLIVISDNVEWWGPATDENRHWSDYQEWVAEGNTAEVVEV